MACFCSLNPGANKTADFRGIRKFFTVVFFGIPRFIRILFLLSDRRILHLTAEFCTTAEFHAILR